MNLQKWKLFEKPSRSCESYDQLIISVDTIDQHREWTEDDYDYDDNDDDLFIH